MISTPRKGQVVLCYFPWDEFPNKPGPDARPVIVLSVDTKAATIMVCYGTGQNAYDNIHSFAATDLVISDPKERNAFGVDETTRFDMTRICELPLTVEWFRVSGKFGKNSAQIGDVPKSKLAALFAALNAAGRGDLVPSGK